MEIESYGSASKLEHLEAYGSVMKPLISHPMISSLHSCASILSSPNKILIKDHHSEEEEEIKYSPRKIQEPENSLSLAYSSSSSSENHQQMSPKRMHITYDHHTNSSSASVTAADLVKSFIQVKPTGNIMSPGSKSN